MFLMASEPAAFANKCIENSDSEIQKQIAGTELLIEQSFNVWTG